MAVFRVASQAQFETALKSVRGGDSILLGSGTYDKLTLTAKAKFDGKVTIASADPDRPAVVKELFVSGAKNVTFSDIKFDWDPKQTSVGPVYIQNSEKITLSGVTVEGQVVRGYGEGVGIRARSSSDIVIEDSVIKDLKNGANITGIEGLTISGNQLRNMSNDGLILGGLDGAAIVGNDFRDFKSDPKEFHKDAIQVVSSKAIGTTTNLLIEGNTVVNPAQAHGFFFGNNLAKDDHDLTGYYENITIKDNYLKTAHTHGVTIEHGKNISIVDNTIVANTDTHKAGAAINIPLINVSSSSIGVEISGNKVASAPSAANATWTVEDNQTGSRKLLHWESALPPAKNPTAPSLKPGQSEASAEPLKPTPGPAAEQDAADAIVSKQAGMKVGVIVDKTGGDLFRFNGKVAASKAEADVHGLDLEGNDIIVFRNFEAGTFSSIRGGNRVDVFDNGKGVKLDSALDLHEVAAASKLFTAVEIGDDVTLTIKQTRGYVQLTFDDLRDDFLHSHHPDLF